MNQLDATPALPGGGRANRRFRAVLDAVVPEASSLSTTEWREAQGIIARAIGARPPAVRRQIGLFMRALDALTLVKYGRPLHTVATNDATRLLEALSKSKLLLLRRGVWGVRTLAFMGYYARADAGRAIGYRARAGGWSARQEQGAPHD